MSELHAGFARRDVTPRLEQHGIDIRGDEWASARRLLAPLQWRGHGKLDGLGVKQRDPGERIARGVDHPAC